MFSNFLHFSSFAHHFSAFIKKFLLSISIILVLGLFKYPTGAQPGQTPFLIFCRKPLFTFSRKLSTKYFDWPKAILSMNNPCGVGSNQKVGNLRDLIKPRSTK